MKYYTITVNGNTYEVAVEEGISAKGSAAPAQAPAAVREVHIPAPAVQEEKPAPVKAPAAGQAGSIKINSPMPGKIISIKAEVGNAIKKGEVILILEAMKMENEIVATHNGTVASVNVSAGQIVEAGELLATLNE